MAAVILDPQRAAVFLCRSRSISHAVKQFVKFHFWEVFKFFFANRAVDIWNLLPDAVVLQPSLLRFRSALVGFDLSRFIKGRGLDV